MNIINSKKNKKIKISQSLIPFFIYSKISPKGLTYQKKILSPKKNK